MNEAVNNNFTSRKLHEDEIRGNPGDDKVAYSELTVYERKKAVIQAGCGFFCGEIRHAICVFVLRYRLRKLF